jgi:hypothetical protein
VLSGPTCDPDDTILAEVWLPETRVGERLYILNTGAYSFVYATNFHGFAPPDIHFISKGESLDTLWGEKQAVEGFKPEYDEEKRYVREHSGQTGTVYFNIQTVPTKWLTPLWEIYHESLHMDETIQEQSCYDRDTFISTLNDADYLKEILVVDDEPMALMMGTNSIKKAAVAYVNPAFLRDHFKSEIEEGRFWYITCLFMSPRTRNLGFMRQMFVAMLDGISDRNWVLAGDFADNRLFVPEMIERISQDVGMPLKKHLLGTQSYFAFSYKPTNIKLESEKNAGIGQGLY